MTNEKCRIYRSETENQGPFELAAEFSVEDARSGKLPWGVVYEPDGVFHTVKNLFYPEGIPLRESPLVIGMEPAAGGEVRGLYRYTDRASKAGFPHWYTIRIYDSGHPDWKGLGAVAPLESAPGPGGAAILGRTYGLIPAVPASDVFNRFEKRVALVPNPFKIDDQSHTYQMTPNMRFINLPSRCQIDIYDAAGQRVWRQYHDSMNLGEAVWSQTTEGQTFPGTAVYSGVYFFKVTSLMPESMWKTQAGTFLVIK